MEWQQPITVALVGIAAELLGGVLGLGGAIIIIPAIGNVVGLFATNGTRHNAVNACDACWCISRLAVLQSR